MSLTLDELLKMQEHKKSIDIDTYKKVYKSVESVIRYEAELGNMACLFKVPEFMFGLPKIDIPKTTEYIIGLLNSKGFMAVQVQYDLVYISWETTKKLRIKKKEEMTTQKNIIEELNQERQQDLTSFLVASKLKENNKNK